MPLSVFPAIDDFTEKTIGNGVGEGNALAYPRLFSGEPLMAPPPQQGHSAAVPLPKHPSKADFTPIFDKVAQSLWHMGPAGFEPATNRL